MKEQVLLLSLDLNKAFDSVLWPYLFSVLQQMGFKDEFLHAIQALYYQPKTRIKLPGCNSDFFTLGRGIRQGCPLSPLLFALALESLAISIKQHPDISGYSLESSYFKLCMYADDVMIFMTQPHISLPNLFTILTKFASISGLAVNITKSAALPVNLPSA